MAAEFPYTIYNDHSERWDFSRFIPEVVCINLGTNDFSGPGYKVELYEKAYRDFLSMVRSHYRDVPIVLLTGSMLQGETNELQKKTLDRIADDFKKVGDNKIYRLDFSPQKGVLAPELQTTSEDGGRTISLVEKTIKVILRSPNRHKIKKAGIRNFGYPPFCFFPYASPFKWLLICAGVPGKRISPKTCSYFCTLF